MSAVLETVKVRPAVIPYYREKENFPPDILNRLYRKLEGQELLSELLHNRAMFEQDFCKFLTEDALTSIFLDIESRAYVGLAWLDNIEECETLTKASASFCFFREYWNPSVTDSFGEIFLGHAFNILGLDCVYGITPKPNRLSRRYCTRMGFRYVATIPQFVSYHGQTVDGMVCVQTKTEFNSRS